MPAISPTIPSSAASTSEQVKLLQDLLVAFGTFAFEANSAQGRLHLVNHLTDCGLPVNVLNSKKVDVGSGNKQTVQIANRLVFTSPTGCLRDCTKWNGCQLICFITSLKDFVKKTEKAFSSQPYDNGDPIAQLRFLRKSLKSDIKVKQSERSVGVSIYRNTVLIANGSTQIEAATKMVSMLRRLVHLEIPSSILAKSTSIPNLPFNSHTTEAQMEPSLVHANETVNEANGNSQIEVSQTSASLRTASENILAEVASIQSPAVESSPNVKSKTKKFFAFFLSKARSLVSTLKKGPVQKSGPPPALKCEPVRQTPESPNCEQTILPIPDPIKCKISTPQLSTRLPKCEPVVPFTPFHCTTPPKPPGSATPITLPPLIAPKPEPLLPSLPGTQPKIEFQSTHNLPAFSGSTLPLTEKLRIRSQMLTDYRRFASPGTPDLAIFGQIMASGKTKFTQLTETHGKKYRTTFSMVGIHQVYGVASTKEQSKAEAHQSMAKFIRDIVALVDSFTVAYQSGKQSDGELLASLARQHSKMLTIVHSQTQSGQYAGTAVNIIGLATFNIKSSEKEKAETQMYSETVRYLKQLTGLTESIKTGSQTVPLEKKVISQSLTVPLSVSSGASSISKSLASPSTAAATVQTVVSSPFTISEERLEKRRQLLADYAMFEKISKNGLEILSKLMRSSGTKFTCTTRRHNKGKQFRGAMKIGDIHQLEAFASSEAMARAEVLQKTAVYVSSIARLISRFKVLRLNQGATKSDGALVAVLAKEYPKLVRVFRKTHKPNLYSTTVDLFGLAGFVGRPMASEATSEGTTFKGTVEYLEKLSQFEVKAVNSKQFNTQPLAATSTEPVETKSKYLLPQEVSKRIYDAVANRWKSLPMENRRCKVLAAFVLTSDHRPDDIRVLSIGTGSKIISSDALQSETGTVVHDSHAEVIARRALICLFYEHLMALLDNGLTDKSELILERIPPNSSNSGQCFRLKAHLKLHLYVTVPPCGASFQSLDDKLRYKKEALAGYFEADETFISNLCHIQAGKNGSTFMACSDKIAMWNVVGLQGALLGQLLEPVYLNSLLVSENFKYDTFTRAFYGRVNSNKLGTYLGEKSAGFRLNEHLVGVYRPNDHEKCFDLMLPKNGVKISAQSHNWYLSLGSAKVTFVELINSRKGTLFHAEGKPSRLAKCRLVERYQRLIAHKHFVALSTSLTSNSDALTIARHGKNRGTYANLKEQSMAYQAAKIALVRTLEESGLGSWIHAYGGVQDMFPVK